MPKANQSTRPAQSTAGGLTINICGTQKTTFSHNDDANECKGRDTDLERKAMML